MPSRILAPIEDRLSHFFQSKNLRARPSKTYLFRLFDEDIADCGEEAQAADIASANFKKANVFENRVYYGVDMDEEALRSGLQKYADIAYTDYLDGAVDSEAMSEYASTDENRSYVAVHGDMREQLFPPESLDVIASTHTFHHVPHADHASIAENFCDWLRPGGTLFLQLSDSDWYNGALQELLESEFETVEKQFYGNKASTWYESILSDDEGVVRFRPDDSKLKKLVMYSASLSLLPLERSGLSGGKSIYLRCYNRQS